ncbi:hypothetical protein GE061_004246 [Apolygus lucorum]|uniref:Uncharacterized protein n=1 Tax=Apolygus lucorum TaxID=248454 RepID=A0A8S9X0I7_APOLU|nr:hypothetical protein GE061_004246 [Apolygus lucorum]
MFPRCSNTRQINVIFTKSYLPPLHESGHAGEKGARAKDYFHACIFMLKGIFSIIRICLDFVFPVEENYTNM